MKSGCVTNVVFAILVAIVFAFSSYAWFTFFIRGQSVSTPNLIGKNVADARAICSDIGITLQVDPEHKRNSDKVPSGDVVWQNRTPGATNLIKRGTAIRVQLSAGPLILRVPDFGGQSVGTAVLRLGQQNLRVGGLTYINSPQEGILAADPPKGTVVPADTAVSLLVGVAPPPPDYVMPDLIDQPLDQVRPFLQGHGLQLSTVKFEAYPGIPDGIIIRQFPLRGAPVSARDPITVVVSRQEETGIGETPK